LEGRAARIIQLAWRKYREEKQAKEIKVKYTFIHVALLSL
jgi:hypothetical protein